MTEGPRYYTPYLPRPSGLADSGNAIVRAAAVIAKFEEWAYEYQQRNTYRGEMGTIVTYERTQRFHDLTLGRMEPSLRAGGYCGYINLNTIVNEEGIWPLEFTCRFGYPGYAILDPLQETSWGELFHSIVNRTAAAFQTANGFSA